MFWLIIFLSSNLILADVGAIEHKVVQPKGILGYVASFVSMTGVIQKLIKYVYPAPISSDVVKVSNSSALSDLESQAFAQRLEYIKPTLQKEFDITAPLKISFCCSGGGNRAMVGCLGFLKAAADTKVLDVTSYIAGVSGSTWLLLLLSKLLSNSHKNETLYKTLVDIQNNFKTSLSQSPSLCFSDMCSPALLPFHLQDNFLLELAKRYAYNQQLSLVNLFGPLVANSAFDILADTRLDETWSGVADSLTLGNQPIPLCSVIYQKYPDISDVYEWVEVSPYQVGNSQLGYIPLQYFGCEFSQGTLKNNSVSFEYPMSFLAGLFGSAFSGTIQELLRNLQQRSPSSFSILDIFQPAAPNDKPAVRSFSLFNNSLMNYNLNEIFLEILNERIPYANSKFHNYAYGMGKELIYTQKNIAMFDAGLDFNFPIPILLHRPQRELDLIIIYDSHPVDTDSLQRADEYVYRNKYTLPKLSIYKDKEEYCKQSMTVVNDPRQQDYQSTMPTVLYFPTLGIDVTSPPYTTFNFKYTSQQVDCLVDTTSQLFYDNFAAIKDIMQMISKKKYQSAQ